MRYRLAIDNLGKTKQVTTMESVLKISRHANERRRNDKTDLQRSDEARGLHTRKHGEEYEKYLQRRNVEDVGNYRPICTLPALLDRAQPEDQGGFRLSYQTLDHLATHGLHEQKCREWGVKMWVATVDSLCGKRSKNAVSKHNTLAIRGSERDTLDRQRKRHIRDKEVNETR